MFPQRDTPRGWVSPNWVGGQSDPFPLGQWICLHAPCSYGDPMQWTAFLGTPFLSSAEGQLERVARIYRHPFYNLYTLDYDVALLELAGPVRRSRLVRPICLPGPARPPEGARCVITGWGSLREGGKCAPRGVVAVEGDTRARSNSLPRCRRIHGSTAAEGRSTRPQ